MSLTLALALALTLALTLTRCEAAVPSPQQKPLKRRVAPDPWPPSPQQQGGMRMGELDLVGNLVGMRKGSSAAQRAKVRGPTHPKPEL